MIMVWNKHRNRLQRCVCPAVISMLEGSSVYSPHSCTSYCLCAIDRHVLCVQVYGICEGVPGIVCPVCVSQGSIFAIIPQSHLFFAF